MLHREEIEYAVRALVCDGFLKAPPTPTEVRRDRLDRMVAALAGGDLAGATGGEWPEENIVAYATTLLDAIDAHLEQEESDE